MWKAILTSSLTRNLLLALSTTIVAFLAKKGFEVNKEFVDNIFNLGLAAIGGATVTDFSKAKLQAAIVSSPDPSTEQATAKILGTIK